MKWSLILADRLGPEILTMLEIKGQVLHLVRVHLKVPGWLYTLGILGEILSIPAPNPLFTLK